MEKLFTVRGWLVVNLCALAVLLASPLTVPDVLADGAIVALVAAGWFVVATKLPSTVVDLQE